MSNNFEISRKITAVITSGEKYFTRKSNITVEFYVAICGNAVARIYKDSKLMKTCRGISHASIEEVEGFVRSVLDVF